MEKPSRRRSPLLGPLPLRLPRLTRFIISHPVRMGERVRQIRRSATMGNISELKRGRSRGTRRCTPRTLTSSSKVEAASTSDKGEIRPDADHIQGAPGDPGQVALSETTHGGPPRPPLDLLNIPDEFKYLESDRLLPCDFKNISPSAMQQYDDYLKWFYESCRDPAPDASLADIASRCLATENSMTSLWVKSQACSNVPDSIVNGGIVSSMHTAIKEKGEIEHPFAFDAAECLDKEAKLICEWLRRGRRIFTDDAYTLCHNIRAAATKLFLTRRKSSVHISAALLGIRKEAEWLIENMKRNSDESITTSMKIRQFALDLLWKKFHELEPVFAWGNEEFIETTDSEGDDDVADNHYMGDCYDEDYMKLYR